MVEQFKPEIINKWIQLNVFPNQNEPKIISDSIFSILISIIILIMNPRVYPVQHAPPFSKDWLKKKVFKEELRQLGEKGWEDEFGDLRKEADPEV